MSYDLLIESNFNDVEVLTESESGEKQYFIEGIFMQSDVVNRNRRIYPDSIMESEVARYKRDFVDKDRAVGELTHPEGPAINLPNASHKIESLSKNGKNYIGKAKILNTPYGNIAKGLLEGGVQLGVSFSGCR